MQQRLNECMYNIYNQSSSAIFIAIADARLRLVSVALLILSSRSVPFWLNIQMPLLTAGRIYSSLRELVPIV